MGPDLRATGLGILLILAMVALGLRQFGLISMTMAEWAMATFLLLAVLDRLERQHRPVPPA